MVATFFIISPTLILFFDQHFVTSDVISGNSSSVSSALHRKDEQYNAAVTA